jgi:hypothetical protein
VTKHLYAAFSAFGILAVCLALADAIRWSQAEYAVFNTIFPITLSLISIWFAFKIVQYDPNTIWTPAVLFLAHIAVFRGIGPLVYIFGNEVTQAQLWSGAWGITPEELLSTHLLNTVGAMAVVGGMLLYLTFSRLDRARLATATSAITVPQAVLFFMIPGIIIRYGVVIPATFGTGSLILIPGALIKLTFLIDLAFALLAFLAVTRKGQWQLIFWALFIPHYFTLFLEFQKSALVLGGLLPIIGAYTGSRSVTGLVRNVLILTVIYLGSQPVVHNAREEMNATTGEIFGASFSQRVDIATDMLFSDEGNLRDLVAEEEFQGGWSRLSYAANQAIAMRAYDAGGSAETIQDVWAVFVPRFLWPEKPTFTYLGRDFYYVITGNAESRTLVGSTVFADAYWNFGWLGVTGIALTVGLFFGFATKYTLRFIRRQEFIYLPAIMMAMDLAMRKLNGWVLTGFLGQLPFYFAFLAMVWVFTMLLKGPGARRAGPSAASTGAVASSARKEQVSA